MRSFHIAFKATDERTKFATVAKRDNIFQDDYWVMLDTFNDKRKALCVLSIRLEFRRWNHD